MARHIVKLPDVGEGTTEAEIVAWHVKIGDTVEEDDPLVEVMTDKATVELPAPVSGKVVAIHGAVGEKRAVGSDLVELEVAGEEAEENPHPPAAMRRAPPSPAMRAREDFRIKASPRPHCGRGCQRSNARRVRAPPSSGGSGAKSLASPAVRQARLEPIAANCSASITSLAPGPEGRITRADLDAYIAGAKTGNGVPATALPGGTESGSPIVGLRRAIAEPLEVAPAHPAFRLYRRGRRRRASRRCART